MSDAWSRLAELGQRHALDEAATAQLETLLRVLGDDPQAPSAVRAPAEAVDVHVADSLVALDLPAVRGAPTLADLGSGPGFPGLALAAALPETRVVAVESARRKCEYLQRASAEANLANVEVVNARAESWSEGIDGCELVTARAVAPLPVVVEYAAPLLRIGGTLVVWRGRRDSEEEERASRAGAELGLEPQPPLGVRPFPAATDRHLHAFVKRAGTPAGYPRRPGAAAKRPLGGRDRPRR